jgi:hypothetical protein
MAVSHYAVAITILSIMGGLDRKEIQITAIRDVPERYHALLAGS